MKDSIFLVLIFVFMSCTNRSISTGNDELNTAQVVEQSMITDITIDPLLVDEKLSIRAIEIDKSGMLAYSGNNGRYGFIDERSDIDLHEQLSDSLANALEYRGISFHSIGASFISAGNPALVYKINYIDWTPGLVYEENDERVFYDSMEFWNDREGIAFGDAMDGCMSVLITRDGGSSWSKLTCSQFPEAYEGEGAFAASDTNIKIIGDKTWLASKHKIYYSPDKGSTWELFDTPIIQEEEAQGIYSLDFYDENIGVAIGGDYTDAKSNKDNLIGTVDGGKTWAVISSEDSPGYRSCIQFIPNSGGKGLLAVGYEGIDVSQDGGNTWTHLSDEGFYTARFLNAKEGFLAGKGRISKFQLN